MNPVSRTTSRGCGEPLPSMISTVTSACWSARTVPLIIPGWGAETADVAIGGAVAYANPVGNGIRSSVQQSLGGGGVSSADLIVTGINVDDYKTSLLHSLDERPDLISVDGLSSGCYLAGLVIASRP